MESKAFIDKEQSKTIIKIAVALSFAFGVTFTFKDDILALLRHHPTTKVVSQKNIQTVKIATAE